jgi:hypothetical protein
MPIAQNSNRYRAGTDSNHCYRRALKKWDIRNKSGTAGHNIKKKGRMGTLTYNHVIVLQCLFPLVQRNALLETAL